MPNQITVTKDEFKIRSEKLKHQVDNEGPEVWQGEKEL